jgi:RNA polymerase sigma-70 factor (ECF subfamily)
MRWITTTKALEELRESNDAAVWRQFQEYFYPVVANFAKAGGLSLADAQDAAQQVMLEFVQAFRAGKYEREKGRLSSWLYGLARRVVQNYRRHLPREQLISDNTSGTAFWDGIADKESTKKLWDKEWREMALEKVLQQVRKETDKNVFEAFELYALKGKNVTEVAEQLGISRNAVYIAKSRVLTRLRQLQKEFEDTD